MSVVRLQSDRVDIRRQWQSNGLQCTREIMHDERAVRSNHELSITENIPKLNRYSIQWVKFLSAVDRFVLLPTRSRLGLDNLFNRRSNSCFFSFLFNSILFINLTLVAAKIIAKRGKLFQQRYWHVFQKYISKFIE